jgi:hypothetical protein
MKKANTDASTVVVSIVVTAEASKLLLLIETLERAVSTVLPSPDGGRGGVEVRRFTTTEVRRVTK